MTQIAVSATLISKRGFENDVQEVLLEVLKQSREEKGCLQYNLYESLEDKQSFMLYELWENQEAVEKHGQTPHYQSYRKNIELIILSRIVHKWNPINL